MVSSPNNNFLIMWISGKWAFKYSSLSWCKMSEWKRMPKEAREDFNYVALMMTKLW